MSSASELPFVSVVVPTRDRAELLGDCLSSLAAQEYPIERYEVIVVDDGSRDRTPEVVQAMRTQASGPPLHYIQPCGRGPNAARNAGLRVARGELIAFVDDDVLAVGGLTRLGTRGYAKPGATRSRSLTMTCSSRRRGLARWSRARSAIPRRDASGARFVSGSRGSLPVYASAIGWVRVSSITEQ